MPTIEWRNKTWSNLDLALALKKAVRQGADLAHGRHHRQHVLAPPAQHGPDEQAAGAGEQLGHHRGHAVVECQRELRPVPPATAAAATTTAAAAAPAAAAVLRRERQQQRRLVEPVRHVARRLLAVAAAVAARQLAQQHPAAAVVEPELQRRQLPILQDGRLGRDGRRRRRRRRRRPRAGDS